MTVQMMSPDHTLRETQQRMIQHYVDKLRQANAAIKKGREQRAYWYSQIDQDWGQITQWQAWAARWKENPDYRERARWCSDLCVVGTDVLRVRQSPPERLIWLQQGLEAAEAIEDGASERQLLFQLGQTMVYIGSLDGAEGYARRLLDEADEAGDPASVGRAWYMLGSAALNRGKLEDAETAFQRGLEAFEPLHDEIEIGRALQGIGRAAMFRGDDARAYDLFQRYLRIVERYGGEAELSTAYITMNHVSLNLRDFAAAKDYAARALDICRRVRFQRMIPSALLSLGASESELDELESASEHLKEGIDAARAVGAKATMIDQLRILADVEARQGQREAAWSHFQESLTLTRELRMPYYLADISATLAWWELVWGDEGAARKTLAEGTEAALTIGDNVFLANSLLSAAKLAQHMDKLELAAAWAGLLTMHAERLSLRFFDQLHADLKSALSEAPYRAAVEKGKALALKETVIEIQQALSSGTL